MPYMKTWILQFLSQLCYIYLNFFLAPRMGGSKFGQQPHTPAFHPRCPVLKIDHARFFQLFVSWPRPNGPFLVFLMNVDESCVVDPCSHGMESVGASAGTFAASQHIWTPIIQNIVGRQAPIIGFNQGTNLQLLDPSTRPQISKRGSQALHSRYEHVFPSNSLVRLVVKTCPFCLIERAYHDTHVYQIEILVPSPLLLHVIDFEYTIGRHPGYWRWKQVDAANGGYCQSEYEDESRLRKQYTMRKHIGNITICDQHDNFVLIMNSDSHSPSSFTGSNIKNILGRNA